jgi:hypothetical protein
MSVRVDYGGVRWTILADVAVHPARVTHPEWIYSIEHDPAEARRTRERLWSEVDGEHVACGHFPGGLGRIRRDDGRLWWESLNGDR